MKALCIHAHFDDFEFVAGGTFLKWHQKLGGDFHGKLIVCTDGEAGHHSLTRSETGEVRLAEQQRSAELGGYDFEMLRLPDGRIPREGCLDSGAATLASLWRCIREFEPDYLFAPPLPVDPDAGVHVDHWMVAEAVRKVAYLINVPHAFTPEFPADERRSRPCKVPVILTTYDAYMTGANACDLVVETEDVFEKVADLTWCHQSQIVEWLPWVGRHEMSPPASRKEWAGELRRRVVRQNRDLGLKSRRATEVFRVTAWGEIPDASRLIRDFPGLKMSPVNRTKLKRKLENWKP